MSKSLKNLATYIQGKLDRHEATKSDICKSAKISRVTLDSYLNGETAPSLEMIDKISDALGDDVYYMISGARKFEAISSDHSALLEAVSLLPQIHGETAWQIVLTAMRQVSTSNQKQSEETA